MVLAFIVLRVRMHMVDILKVERVFKAACHIVVCTKV